MRKIMALLLACLLLVCSLFSAQGEIQYPDAQGNVTDLAGVLTQETEQDLISLSALLEKETQGKLFVVTRHFLGGKDASLYAQGLFDHWQLKENDGLLLMVVGEERFALALGENAKKALPDESRTALLGAFRTAYLGREYDRATAELASSLASSLSQAQGKSLSLAGLFGQEAPSFTPAPKSWEQVRQEVSGLWLDMFGEVTDEVKEWEEKQNQEEVKSNWKTVLIWGLVIYFLFFRKKKRKKKRRR